MGGTDGWVVRFDNIDPGADGEIVLTMIFDGTGTNQGKYSNAISIAESDPPADTEDPVVDPSQVLAVDEDVLDGAVVGTVTATDNIAVTGFQITGGDPDGVFAIDSAGQITVADNRTLDNEATTSYSLSVTATDAATNTSAPETVTVNVTDKTEPTSWEAYNDMSTSTGGPNAANTTGFDYEASGERLTDFGTGLALPVKLTGSWVNGYDPVTTGANVTTAASLAYTTFNAIVDLAGNFELDAANWDNVVTITGLDPAKTYAITVTANRDNTDYAGERFTKVTLGGADAAANSSSAGTIENVDGSVSFSVGYNTVNGYAVKFTGVDPGADGTITITSEWDDAQPGTKGYAMTAMKLETE